MIATVINNLSLFYRVQKSPKNKFIHLILIFIFTTFSLQAKILEEDYSVEFGILGEVAKVQAKLISDAKHYRLDAKVSVVGTIAKAVTHNLKEQHISKGHIVDGLLVTDMYQMIKSYGEYTSTTIYSVNHKKKKVTRHYKKWKNGKKVINRKVTLGYYGKDDLVTLFLNLDRHMVLGKKHTTKYIFKVVGADRKNGRVDVLIPSKNIQDEMTKLVGIPKPKENLYNVTMHRQLYHSKKGELQVRMGEGSIVEKAVLKDLIFFGDVRIIRQ